MPWLLCPYLSLSSSSPNTRRCSSTASCLDCNLITCCKSYLTRKSLTWTFFSFFSPYPVPLLPVSPLLCLADLERNKVPGHGSCGHDGDALSLPRGLQENISGAKCLMGVQEKFIIRKWSKGNNLRAEGGAKYFCVLPELVLMPASGNRNPFSTCYSFLLPDDPSLPALPSHSAGLPEKHFLGLCALGITSGSIQSVCRPSLGVAERGFKSFRFFRRGHFRPINKHFFFVSVKSCLGNNFIASLFWPSLYFYIAL